MFSKLGGGGKPEEEKTVTAGTSVIEVLPSSGKTMKKVKVNPTPSQSKTVSPSTLQQTVSPDAGKLLSQVIVNAMVSGALSDITVSSAGLITAQVGTSGYLASGTKKTKQLTTQAAKTWTPGTSDQTISSGRYLTGVQTIKGDSDLLPENIRDGIDIFGVLGTMVEGVDLLGIFGCTKIAVDTFTVSSRKSLSSAGNINHSLGTTPKVVLVLSTIQGRGTIEKNFVASLQACSTTYGACIYTTTTESVFTATTLVWNTSSSYIWSYAAGVYLAAGVEYTIITMA